MWLFIIQQSVRTENENSLRLSGGTLVQMRKFYVVISMEHIRDFFFKQIFTEKFP